MKKQLLLFKALSDETRFRIVEFLLGGERCVCKIYPHVKRSQSTVSLQLNKLERFGIVKQKRDGKYIIYSIKNKDVFKILGSIGLKK